MQQRPNACSVQSYQVRMLLSKRSPHIQFSSTHVSHHADVPLCFSYRLSSNMGVLICVVM